MTRMSVLTAREAADWQGVLDACAPYDFYHLPAYHAMAEDAGEGEARLFVYTAGANTIALPLLLRPVGGELPAGADGPAWRDATSVYGYAGPVSSPLEIRDAVIRDFQAALVRQLRELRVVSVFSRLHPFFPQRPLLAGLGDFTLSRTVSIDLTLSDEAQRSAMRASHRHRVNKLRRQGVTCVEDVDGRYLAEFRDIYRETMCRVGAAERYFLPDEYFDRLRQALGERLHLFIGFAGGRVVCGVLIVACHGLVQYHLSGTRDEALPLAPMGLVIDEVRQWAMRRGERVLHLGGGRSAAPDDTLLHFKRGFSDRLHEFATWRWVVRPEVYRELCAARARRDAAQGRRADPHFFPAYRAPAVARLPALATAGPGPAEDAGGGS